MKNFTNLILEPQYINSKFERTDESLILGGLFALYLISYAFQPVFQSRGFNDLLTGTGKLLGGIGSRISKKDTNKDNKKIDKDNKKIDKDNKKTFSKEDQENFNKLLFLAKKSNDSSKKNTQKKKNDSLIKLLIACSFDKNGEEIPLENRLEKMKDIVPEKQFESLKEEITKTYNNVKDDEKFKKQVKEAAKNTKSEDYEKFIEDSKSEAKKMWSQIENEKKDQEEIDKKLDDLEKKDQKEPTDEEGNTLKDEEITDENGNKKKVKMHIGPRGGKFYYPEGSPKTPENKVYVIENIIEYLYKKLDK